MIICNCSNKGSNLWPTWDVAYIIFTVVQVHDAFMRGENFSIGFHKLMKLAVRKFAKIMGGGEDCDIYPQVTNTINDHDQAVTPSPNLKQTTKQTCVSHVAVSCIRKIKKKLIIFSRLN